MSAVRDFIDQWFQIMDIPGTRVFWAAVVLVIAFVFKRLFSNWILKYLQHWTSKTKTTLDDTLLKILKPPLSYLILLFGFWVTRTILHTHLPPNVREFLDEKLFPFFFVALVCWLIFRSADVFSGFLKRVARRTDTELDDLLSPYVGRVVKIIALIMIVIKGAELFLGMSAGALIGLLGGVGLTLGLVFRDIIVNWFGCAIIYMDELFRVGDWVMLDDGSVIDAAVEEIGLRSTTFRNFDQTISVVPNGTLANGIIKNWSKMHKRRVVMHFRIDGVSAERLQSILDSIRSILGEHPGVHQQFHMVNFRDVDGNARVIRLYYFTKTTAWKEHEEVREQINLKVLSLLESHQIANLAYTIVDMSDDRPREIRVESEE